MAEFSINKGIGASVEFKGLKGLLTLFVLFVILYMTGIDQWFCIGFGVVSASALVWGTFALNRKYGAHGLMKLGAARNRPRYLLHRKSLPRIIRHKKLKRKERRK